MLTHDRFYYSRYIKYIYQIKIEGFVNYIFNFTVLEKMKSSIHYYLPNIYIYIYIYISSYAGSMMHNIYVYILFIIYVTGTYGSD